MGCCESTPIDTETQNLLDLANLNDFNGDVKNIIYCLKALERLHGFEMSDNIKKMILKFIENDEVPDW